MQIRAKVGLMLLADTAPLVSTARSPATFTLIKDSMALTPNPNNGAHLYIQYCSACHQRSAWGNGGPAEVPTLAGQREYYILEQLVQFSTLERPQPEMHKAVSRPEIARPQALRDLSAYIASRPRNPDPDHGDGRQLHAGESVYTRSCAMCHGKEGEGSQEEPIPAVGGQHYRYILVQLHNFAKGHRTNAEPPVIDFTGNLAPGEIEAVADYVSRLPALQSR
jgi:cytochrome c553